MTALCGGVTRSSSGGTIDSILYVAGLSLMLSCLGNCRAVVSTSLLKSERMRRTVSEPIEVANAHRIVNVSSADTCSASCGADQQAGSNAAVSRWKKESSPERLMTKLGDAGRSSIGRRRAYR